MVSMMFRCNERMFWCWTRTAHQTQSLHSPYSASPFSPCTAFSSHSMALSNVSLTFTVYFSKNCGALVGTGSINTSARTRIWWCFYCTDQDRLNVQHIVCLVYAPCNSLWEKRWSKFNFFSFLSLSLSFSLPLILSPLLHFLPFTLRHLSTHFKYWWLFFCFFPLRMQMKWAFVLPIRFLLFPSFTLGIHHSHFKRFY